MDEPRAVRADYLVAEAVLRNRSSQGRFPCRQGKEQGLLSKNGLRLRFCLEFWYSEQWVARQFPKKQNRELIRNNRELQSDNRVGRGLCARRLWLLENDKLSCRCGRCSYCVLVELS